MRFSELYRKVVGDYPTLPVLPLESQPADLTNRKQFSASKQFAGPTVPPANTANPRKVSTGTSYIAKGVAAPQTEMTEVGSSQPVRILEVVPELVSPFTRQQV